MKFSISICIVNPYDYVPTDSQGLPDINYTIQHLNLAAGLDAGYPKAFLFVLFQNCVAVLE
jgi:hypothetical protein